VLWDYNAHAEGGTFPAHGAHPITDLNRWREQISFPDVDAMDWHRITRGWRREEPANLDAIDRERYLVCGISEMGLFERSYLFLGMENALVAYLTEPDLMAELLGAIADFKIASLIRFHEMADLDMVWYGDDWGTQRDLFLRPELWRRIVKPHTQRIYACLAERGIIVCQHSCGKIEPIFGDMVDMGADMWNPCQPCNDLAALKRRYAGRITFYGGIDSQFVLARPDVTPADVRAEVRARIDELAYDGGFIAAPSHSVPYDPEILHAMDDEIATYGRAYYGQQA
jgi:uroporphyrinogen-III decarboxylase